MRLLYTEMVTTGAVLHGDRARLIGFDPPEQPVALQLGGSDPKALAQCARIAADFGYVEVNLNVGCPSDRVQEGRFGACLMAEPALVGECVAAMKAAVSLPVTVKCRIGIDEQDPEIALEAMTGGGRAGRRGGADRPRAQGLAVRPVARENRDVPPLDYDRVYRLKAAHPRLPVIINGGIQRRSGASASSARRWRDARPRRVSGAMAALWRSMPRCSASLRRTPR